MKRILSSMLALTLTAASAAAFAESKVTEVIPAEGTKTGYNVTFRYENEEASRVRLFGQWLFTTTLEDSLYHTVQHTPEEWENGMYPECGASFEYREMVKNADGVWECTVPLPHGLYNYCYYVDGAEGAALNDTTDAARISDPTNKPIVFVDDTYHLYSQIYVPYIEELHGLSPDYTFLAPTATQQGTVERVFYTGDNGEEDPMVVYLPYGYDANRAEPYKMLLLNHGAGDSDCGWFNHAWASVILDNLIEAGQTEPLVVVATNNNYQTTANEVIDYVLPYMQSNYNVSKNVEDLAVGGLSMGGMFTTTLMTSYPDAFSYYGIWSSGVSESSMANYDFSEPVMEVLRNKTIYVSAGDTDFAYNGTMNLEKLLAENNVPFLSDVFPGGHQWTVWRAQLKTMLTDVLWK